MHLSIQLCGLLLYALVSTASSQEKERMWHSTVPGPASVSIDAPAVTSGVPAEKADPVVAEPEGDEGSAVPQEVDAATESSVPAPQPDDDRDSQIVQDVLAAEDKTQERSMEEPLSDVEGKKDKKERKWMSAPKEVVEEKVLKEEADEEKVETKQKIEQGTVEESQNLSEQSTSISDEVTTPNVSSVDDTTNNSTEDVKPKKNKKKPRKWMSVPGMAIEEENTFRPAEDDEVVLPTEEDLATAKESLDLAQQAVVEEPLTPSESAAEQEIDPYSINALDMALPENITELLMAAEEGIPLVQEIIVSKKTTVYVTISDSVDAEPLFVNLTGIRHFTGQERRMMTGCLDLSDLMLTGEEAKEVIQRMSKHKFHKLDLSNNNITEFPANTFSPVAFTVRELRLDGNPLASNDQGEASVLQRGGLFHLTELRELNLSSCGLVDMDYFTPWNSNHLEVVDLSNNKLSTVPSNLQFFHKLKKLFLDGNPITGVTELPFALLWNMQVLSLASCEIASIADDPFRNMDKLKELSLEGNNMTQIGQVRLPRSNSAVKMFISGNPWHCACEMLNFIEHYHYAIRDIEYIRCSSPRWLEGLRTAYLTKEILSLDSIDGDCTSQSPRVSASHHPVPVYSATLRTDRLQVLALIVFVMAALFMLCHVLWARKKDKYRYEDDRDDIHYIRIEKKPNFK